MLKVLEPLRNEKVRITQNLQTTKVDRKKIQIMKRIIEEFGEGEEDDEQKK